jgi:hypothetical protein
MWPEHSCGRGCMYDKPDQIPEGDKVETREFNCIVDGVKGRGAIIVPAGDVRDYQVTVDFGDLTSIMRFEFVMTMVNSNPDMYVVNRIRTVIGSGAQYTISVGDRQPLAQCFAETLKFLIAAIYKQHHKVA